VQSLPLAIGFGTCRLLPQELLARFLRAKLLGRDPGDLSSVENPEALEEIARVL
jgi:hypothetical protein